MKTARPSLWLAPLWGLLSAWDEVRKGLVQNDVQAPVAKNYEKSKAWRPSIKLNN